MTLRDSSTGRTAVIEHKDVDSAFKTVGIHIAVTGSQKAEAAHLLRKSIKFADIMTACPLTRSEAATAYFTVYLPSVTYSFPATCLRKTDLDTVQRPAVNACLSAMGYNRNMPRAVVFAPNFFGGLGFRDLSTEQGTQQVLQLLKHV
jgi:hypothetical protein